ncbi:hypothetical protein LT337_02325 [Mycolicibacterium fortuitum]|nr:hypothetical protein LT337_02325 [Mycolicibacterium fortuitum]
MPQPTVEPTRTTVDLPCGKVSYLTWAADSAAPTVVLLHGGGVDSAFLSWGGIGPGLAQAGYRVIARTTPVTARVRRHHCR